MEQFFFVPAFVYNNSYLNTKTVTRQELQKYPAEQIATYQIDSLRNEQNKKLFAKADSLVVKILSCACIKLSNLHTIFLSDFAHQLRRKNEDVPDVYFTLRS